MRTEFRARPIDTTVKLVGVAAMFVTAAAGVVSKWDQVAASLGMCAILLYAVLVCVVPGVRVLRKGPHPSALQSYISVFAAISILSLAPSFARSEHDRLISRAVIGFFDLHREHLRITRLVVTELGKSDSPDPATIKQLNSILDEDIAALAKTPSPTLHERVEDRLSVLTFVLVEFFAAFSVAAHFAALARRGLPPGSTQ